MIGYPKTPQFRGACTTSAGSFPFVGIAALAPLHKQEAHFRSLHPQSYSFCQHLTPVATGKRGRASELVLILPPAAPHSAANCPSVSWSSLPNGTNRQLYSSYIWGLESCEKHCVKNQTQLKCWKHLSQRSSIQASVLPPPPMSDPKSYHHWDSSLPWWVIRV